MAQFDLKQYFKKAFGYEVPNTTKYNIPTKPTPADNASLGSAYYAKDSLGVEHFLPVTLSGAFTAGAGLVAFSTVLPFAVCSIITKKTIINTAMPQRGGTVKELISIDDYLINIKGLLINDNNSFPEAQITNLHNIFLVNQSLTIRSALTDIFLKGSFNHSVVLREVKWPPLPGVQHVRPFEMDLESDMIFTLEE